MIPDLNSSKILLVDDNKANIDILVHALRNDYKLSVALSGQKALEYARDNPLDLILLDVMMPEMDGFEVCRTLKSASVTENIPIIFITALDDPKDKTKGFEMGAVDYITKPFDVTEVKARVKTHLSLRIAQEKLKIQNIILEVKVTERTRELQKTQKDLLVRLGVTAEWRGKETEKHLLRMSDMAALLGKAAGLKDVDCEMLSQAITVHDLGKAIVPDTILFKPKKLSRKEFDVVKTHAAAGAKLLSGSRSKLLQMAERVALTHHEKWDGSGYPKGLKGEAIPIHGRICAICDVFDALVSDLPYKKAWPLEKALIEIGACTGSHFDPELVRHFLELKPQLVKLVSGR